MKVSVIIPFRKGLPFLEDCLQSLMEQKAEDMEILLVCDHVEEDVRAFIEDYPSLRITVLEPEASSGVAAARNYGLARAQGEYLYFLDSDDYLVDTALELLVKAATEQDCDLVYGKRVGTWMRRGIYLRSNSPDGAGIGAEESAEEDNSLSESTGSDPEGEEWEEEEKKPEEKKLAKKKPAKEEQGAGNNQAASGTDSMQEAYARLIEECNGVRNISVLNILIRRSVLTEHAIRFQEEFKYLSDYPFLLWLMDKAQSFVYEPQAIYLKRTHKSIKPVQQTNKGPEPVQLSRMPGSRSFQEYVDAYQYTAGLIQGNGNLKALLDSKMLDYCLKQFAPKLADTKKKKERAEKFKLLHQILSGMDLSLLDQYRGYDRRILWAFRQGDIRRAAGMAKRRRVRSRWKEITKRRSAFFKFLYLRYFLRQPMRENWVLCESFFGKSYSDSPKYIYEYLSKNYPGRFKFIWVINRKHTDIPYRHIKVKRFSLRYFYCLACSKYYVYNGRQPVWVKKREGNVFLQTWHGTPLKRLVFDLETVSASRQKYKEETYIQSRAWDYLIAANRYSSDIFRRCFNYEKVMLETGYPRNDILHDKDRDRLAARIKARLGIPADKKVILYAPTWRDDLYSSKGRYKFEMKLDLRLLEEKLGGEYVIVLRTHYFIADSGKQNAYTDFTYNLSDYDDISELYLISSILITDYSSVFFDYANLRRPILFFTYDLEKYRDILRGFYINIEEELPGPLVFTTEEIIEAVRHIDTLQQEYRVKYDAFYERFCSWEDGNASERAAKEVFGLSPVNR